MRTLNPGHRLPLAALLALIAAPAVAAPQAEPARIPATGEQTSLVTVDAFGRHRIEVTTDQGVAIEVIDKMAGSLGRAGEAGEQDGSLDLFLEQGQVLVRTRAHVAGEGEATVAVHPFVERSTTPVMLPDELLTTSLLDLEQRSFWVDLKSGERLDVEMAGRQLADLRLWKDGEWLVDAEPDCQQTEPRKGQPLTHCTLSFAPGEGLFLLSAYGGRPLPWTDESGPGDALYVRQGVPKLPAPGAQPLTLSPFGKDRYHLAGTVTKVIAELPEPASFVLSGVQDRGGNPYEALGTRASLTTESREPRASISLSSSTDHPQLVTLTGTPDQPVWLQSFQHTGNQVHLDHGTQWVTTIQTGHAVDAADFTGALVRTDRNGHDEVLFESSIPLSPDKGWERRFNLTGVNQLLLRVEKAGNYQLQTAELERVGFRVEPFMTSRPANYKRPGLRYSEGTLELTPGLWVLTLQPASDSVGAVTASIRPEGGYTGALMQAVGLSEDTKKVPRRYTVQPGLVDLSGGQTHWLWTGQRHGVEVGTLAFEAPGRRVDLSQALPLSLAPGELLSVPVRLPEAGTLRATDERGKPLLLSSGGGFAEALQVETGNLDLQVRHPQALPATAVLWLEPPAERTRKTAPPLPDTSLARLPDLPQLRDGRPVNTDLERGERETWRVIASEPGLYRLESTGLLATSGALRTRTVTSLASARENGTGRNFLLQRYLRQGAYQLSVNPNGRSEGHLGVRLARTTLHDGGALTTATPARVTLEPGEGVVYTFTIAEAGRYRLRTLGQGKEFSCRLEDADGWPIGQPGREADLTETLQPGTYRYVLLPEDLPSARITTLEPVTHAAVADGHGPHPLTLGEPTQHVWWESPEGEERTPDRWTFTLAAEADVTLQATEEMAGVLLRDGETALRLSPGRPVNERLPPGDYTLELVNARRNNGVSYSLTVSTRELVAGVTRQLTAPFTIDVAAGGGLVELSTFGSTDVRAWLTDPDGRVVAVSDDRPDDWNVQILRHLDAGTYRLRVEPVGSWRAQLSLSMAAPRSQALDPLEAPGTRELEPGDDVLTIPLVLPRDPGVLAVSLASTEVVGASIEVREGETWRNVGSTDGRRATLAVRPLPGAEHRLRVWSLDRRGNPVTVSVDARRAARTGEAGLARGAALRPADQSPSVASVVAKLDRPGLLRIEQAPEGLGWCPEPGQACVPVEDGLIATGSSELWLVSEVDSARSRASATLTRAGVATGQVQAVPLATDSAVAIDMERASDGPLVAWVEASEGQPGIALGKRGGEAEPSLEGSELAPGRAVAVQLSGRDLAATVWRASPGSRPGLRSRVHQVSFTAPSPIRVGQGWTQGELGPYKAARIILPRDATVRGELDLDGDLIMAHADGDRVVDVHQAPVRGLHTQVLGTAHELWVFNPTAEPRAWSLLTLPGEHHPAAVTVGAPFERRLARAGAIQVAVDPGEGRRTLHVRGATEALFTSPDGHTQRGRDFDLPPEGGRLDLHHQRGLVLAWASSLTDADGGPFGDVARPPKAAVSLAPIRQPLDGDLVRLSLDDEGAGLLHLSLTDTAVVRVDAGEAGRLTEVLDGGGVLDAWVPGGATELWLRGAAGSGLTGELEASFLTPTPLGEGLGPVTLLGPGDTQVFSFTLAQDGPVGLGVRAARDVVEARLYDQSGQVVSEGVVQMPTLSAGSYVLALHLPPDADAPVRAQPALVGAERPPVGPPEDVIRTYLDLARD